MKRAELIEIIDEARDDYKAVGTPEALALFRLMTTLRIAIETLED